MPLLNLSLATLLPLWLAGSLVPAPEQPLPIVGGTDAGVCQFPTVVAMLVGGSTTICSGTLIHPQVVMTAAHCLLPGSPIDAIAFGEAAPDAGVPAGIRDVAFCTPHPDYAEFGAHDVAFCVLEVPLGLQITPLMAGCESSVLVPGQEVVIAGFGSTFATVDEQGEIQTIEGVGTKRYTTQTIHSIDDSIGVVNFAGPNGSQSACFGDSGGPSFVRLADGTWRVFGTGSTLFDPGGLPPPAEPGNACGVGAAYGNAPLVIDWLESTIGFDITPCHDDAGVFVAGPGCGGFPQDIDQAGADWATGCVSAELGGGVEVCEPFAGPFEPDPTEGDTTGDPPPDPTDPTEPTDPTFGDTTGEPPDPTGVTTVDPTGEVPPLPTPEPTPLPSDSSSGADDGTSGGADQEGGLADRGCGCRSRTDAPASAAWWAVIVGVAARRRRAG